MLARHAVRRYNPEPILDCDVAVPDKMLILPALRQTVMKRFLVLLVMMVALGSVVDGREARVAEYSDYQRHYLKREWRKYERIARRDRPEKEIAQLTFIKEQALKNRLDKDYYDAAVGIGTTQARKNWKLRDSLRNSLTEEFIKAGKPIMAYSLISSRDLGRQEFDALRFAEDNAEVLKQGRNSDFWRRGYWNEGYVCDHKFISNDYEYILWRCLSDASTHDKAFAALNDAVAGDFPQSVLLAYSEALRKEGDKRLEELERLAADWRGNSVALLPRKELLKWEYERLVKNGGGSEQFRDLDSRCLAFEKEREAFIPKYARQEFTFMSSDDVNEIIAKECGSDVLSLIYRLEEKNVSVSVRDDTVLVRFRNIKSANLSVENNGKGVFRKKLDNQARSFYVWDTVKVALPELKDGDYRIKVSGLGKEAEISYAHKAVSVAVRRQGDGFAIFPADYISGKPFKEVDVTMIRGERMLTAHMRVDGFTLLPSEMQELAAKKSGIKCGIVCSVTEAGSVRLSKEMVIVKASYMDHPVTSTSSVTGRRRKRSNVASMVGETRWTIGSANSQASVTEPVEVTAGINSRTETYGRIFNDRGAYKPGDTLRFKAVMFRGDIHKRLAVIGKDAAFKVTLYDSQMSIVEEKSFRTNDFGSFAGEFAIPKGRRNGLFKISVSDGDKEITSKMLRVEDFVLPTFELTFDEQEPLYFAGDSVTVSGKVESLSGHSLASARMTLKVSLGGKTIDEKEMASTSDGRFSHRFKAKDQGRYSIKVTVKDETGETREFDTAVKVNNVIKLDVQLTNGTDGDLLLTDLNESNASHGIVTEDKAVVVLEVRDRYSNKVKSEVSYEFKDISGKILKTGKCVSGDEIELPTVEDGLYDLRAYSEKMDSLGKVVRAEKEYNLVKVSRDAKSLAAPAVCLLLPGKTEVKAGEDIVMTLGASVAPLWAVATMIDGGGNILESRIVTMDGSSAGSLRKLCFRYPAGTEGPVKVQLFFFKYGRCFKYEHIYSKASDELVLPLEFSSFTDIANPDTEYTVKVRVPDGAEGLAAIYDKSLDAVRKEVWNPVRLERQTIPNIWMDVACGYITNKSLRNIGGWNSSGINGVVTDMNGEPLIGASVIVEGTSFGTSANLDGYFTLDASPGTLLTISYIGYKSVTLPGTSGMSIALEDDYSMLEETVVIGYGRPSKPSLRLGKRSSDAGRKSKLTEPLAAEASVPDDYDFSSVSVRKIFSESLAFEPFLRPENGEVSFKFKTSDKLSTYHVLFFAHDKAMRNATLTKDFTVTVPVKVSVAAPRYLYSGDKWSMAATVTGNSDAVIDGEMKILEYSGKGEAFDSLRVPMTVKGREQSVVSFPVDVPRGADSLTFKVIFASKSFSDAVLFSVPVREASQVITESHSAIALLGADKEKLLESLRSRFVNVSSVGSVCDEISIGKMIEEAATQKSQPAANDVLSLTEAYCFKSFKSERDTSLLGRILACKNSDGGFGWFEGMRSSQSVTATVLDRMALVRNLGGNIPDLESSVAYLDSTQFLGFPRWLGGLSDDTYMLVRSNFPSVGFKVRMDKSQRKEYRYRLSSFRKYARRYLSPSNRFDFIDGQPGAKARRVRTLSNLISSEAGISLAKAWGERFVVDAALRKSIDEDILTIIEYAVRHDGGGIYYPNAVMPFRGLLENEAYAHSLIADVLSEYASSHSGEAASRKAAEVADGVRLWLVLQKETQNWDTDPAFVNALCSVGKGSADLLSTSVVTLTQRVLKPLGDVKASGNGFSIEKSYFIDDKEIRQGDTIRRGDRVRAVYTVQNTENRSFIRLTAPREASLIPVDQLSGIYNLSFVPLTVDGWYRVSPCGYRDVKPDRTVFYFDTYPEGRTTVTEEFFVTQTGTFQAPVPEIESLYAPHYRANAAAATYNLVVK